MQTPMMATVQGEKCEVRSVKTAKSAYVPDENGTFVLIGTRFADKNPNVVRVTTVTTRLKRENGRGTLYRIDQTATARDRDTLARFAEQFPACEREVWSIQTPAVHTVSHI